MNDIEALEVELAALQPRSASAQLTARIAEQLDKNVEELPTLRSRRVTSLVGALATALGIALSVVVIVLLRHGDSPTPLPPAPFPQFPLAVAFDSSLPSAWTYHCALTLSPQNIDALLDAHAHQPPGRASDLQLTAFPMSSTHWQSF